MRSLSRAAGRSGLAALLLLIGCESLQNAVAEGDTRTISLRHLHTGEDLTVTYKRNGRYDEDALKKINWILRDWRRNEDIRMEPRLIDLVWEVQRDLGAKEAIQIICGYRAPQTNSMLRQRSGGVARFSQHMLGKAMDFYIPGVPLEDLRAAGLRLQRGGVGFYPSSGSPFVHLDIGSVRHWPRMTRDQLVRVFPNGRTVHVPSDGHPLPGYALALAELEKNGVTPSATSLEAAQRDGIPAASPKRSTLAKLFGFKEKDEEEDAETTASTGKPTALALRAPEAETRTPIFAPPVAKAVPLPKAKPAMVEVAAAQPPQKPAQPVAMASNSDDIFQARGYWRGLPEAAPTPLRPKPIETASADPNVATIGPFAAPAKPSETQTLAYAAPAEPAPARPAPMGKAMPRATAAAESGILVAHKSADDRPSVLQSSLSLPERAAPAKPGEPANDPWLRAVTLTPSVGSFLNTTLLGAPDFRQLRPFFQKPAMVVMMTFSADPDQGMTYRQFTGRAVNFLATASFTTRTAALQ